MAIKFPAGKLAEYFTCKDKYCKYRKPHIMLLTCSMLMCCIQCSSPVSEEEMIEQKALQISAQIDDNALAMLKDFSYGASGEDNFWLRTSGDTNVYVCNFKHVGDTSKLSFWRPHQLMQDFSMAFPFDTATYAQYTFFKVRNEIVKIEMDSSNGNILTKDTLINLSGIFTGENPFAMMDALMAIKNKFNFIGCSYSGGMGDFYLFWISPQYKLLFIPDTLNLDAAHKKYWLDQFKKGKELKPHWSLINILHPYDKS